MIKKYIFRGKVALGHEGKVSIHSCRPDYLGSIPALCTLLGRGGGSTILLLFVYLFLWRSTSIHSSFPDYLDPIRHGAHF